jgi:ABC-type proline/glycine betaine transport system permease subunit
MKKNKVWTKSSIIIRSCIWVLEKTKHFTFTNIDNSNLAKNFLKKVKTKQKRRLFFSGKIKREIRQKKKIIKVFSFFLCFVSFAFFYFYFRGKKVWKIQWRSFVFVVNGGHWENSVTLSFYLLYGFLLFLVIRKKHHRTNQ